MLIAVDHGNYAVKTVNFSFTSGLSEHSVKPPLASEIIEYNGSFWTLTGQRISYMRNKTRDERYFILTLFAIARELEKAGNFDSLLDIELAVGLPPEHFGTLNKQFADYFRRENVSFVYNDRSIRLNIKQVFVYPQAYAAVVPQTKLLLDTPRMFIVDIGGYTTDVLLLRSAKPDLQFCRSLEMGVITMNNDVIGKVSSLHDMRIEDEHIAAIIQGQPTVLPQDVAETIKKSAQRHANYILDKLRELQVDLRANPAIFIGGGAVLFKEYIENSPLVVKADFVTDQKANAIGYGMLATAQMKKMSLSSGGSFGEI